MRLGFVLAPLLVAATVGAQAPEAGVSHTLAVARTARVSDVRYHLAYTLVPKAATTSATETLTFADSGAGDLALDFRDGEVLAATLNTKAIATTNVNGHLVLPAAALAKRNTLELRFTANIAAAGKAITRYTDKDDGNEYLYTLFVPMDASMAFPCFDQPDLKARFTLEVVAPGAWTVIGNTHGMSVLNGPFDGPVITIFRETEPISTYLFGFAAGPFERIIAPPSTGDPSLWVRRSQLARARQEAPEVLKMTSDGVAYLSEYFAQPFPFPKYDLVLIPGFPFGGMEHAGATFLNEDGVLFRSTPTASDYFKRDILVLHETTHQWFGDLVTMRWFDDLWLKEGFAQYMAYKAMAALKPETNPWKHFNEDIKPLAYAIDETQGTTPIFQNIPNLKDAKSAYGAIVYQKAPAVLKMLNFKLGDDVFRDGLRLYLKQHAYANATWPDLIGAFTQAGGVGVQAWADAWILQRGMPEITVSFACAKGVLTALTLHQSDVLRQGHVWPIDNEVFVTSADESNAFRASWASANYALKPALGVACPEFVFANADDQAYGRVLLDRESEPAVVHMLTGEVSASPGDPLFKTQLWTALWENVRTVHTAPASYVELALRTLPTENDEALSRIQGGRVATSLHAYLGPKSRRALLPRAEAVVADRMLRAPELGVRIVNFRTFTGISETPAALAQLKGILAGRVVIAGLTLKPLDRWNILGHLIALSDADAPALYAAEAKRDTSGEAQKYAYAAQAGTPDAATKTRYFEEYVHSTTRQEDWITQSLRRFNSYNQQSLTLPYLQRALDELPNIKRNRKIFFLGAWLGAFIDGQTTPDAQAIVHAWLAKPGTDADLRLKVLEVSDSLDRTVAIRRRFPD